MKSGSIPIHLVRATDKTGRRAWYFVLAPHDKIKLVANHTGDDLIDLVRYGQILISGYGEEPTEEAKQFLKEKYDFDADTLV